MAHHDSVGDSIRTAQNVLGEKAAKAANTQEAVVWELRRAIHPGWMAWMHQQLGNTKNNPNAKDSAANVTMAVADLVGAMVAECVVNFGKKDHQSQAEFMAAMLKIIGVQAFRYVEVANNGNDAINTVNLTK